VFNRPTSQLLALALLISFGCTFAKVCARADSPPTAPTPDTSGATTGTTPSNVETGSASAIAKAPVQFGAIGAPSRASSAAQAPVDKGWTFFGSLRVRFEDQAFFPTPKANGNYSYLAETLRFGVMRQTKPVDYLFEMEAPGLFGLPTKAVAPAPQGQLGHGATYFATNKSQVASLFLKQAYVRLKQFSDPANSLKLGRFEFSDGQETVSPDPNLNWIKQNRISQRLIGPFGFTMVTRSFDGAQFVNNTPKSNLTLMGVFPTRGAFDLNGWDSLSDVRVVYLADTLPRVSKKSASDARLFYIYYEDVRNKDIKTDNRPAAARNGDRTAIRIHTLGAHYARVMDLGSGKADVMVWVAGQIGDWGLENHGAFAGAAEIGYQFANCGWKPWIRLCYDRYSGDGNPNNNQHGTFIPILPTARSYARYPFFAEANLQDVFGQVILKPSSKLTLRSDLHALRLAENNDLWYSGGGAFNNSAFGYSGRPSGGKGGLATLLDLSADYQLNKTLAITLYTAYANGGGVVGANFTKRDSGFGYAEVNYKF